MLTHTIVRGTVCQWRSIGRLSLGVFFVDLVKHDTMLTHTT